MLRHSHARSFAARFVRYQRRAGSHAYIKLFFLFFLALLNHVWFNAGHSSCISKANVLRSESSGHQRDNQYYILCFWPLYSFANNLWKQVRGIIEQLVNVLLLLLLLLFFFFCVILVPIFAVLSGSVVLLHETREGRSETGLIFRELK